MSSHQDQFDDAMFDYSTGEYAVAISKLQAILAEDPDHFDARLGLAMSHYRLGDYPTAILRTCPCPMALATPVSTHA